MVLLTAVLLTSSTDAIGEYLSGNGHGSGITRLSLQTGGRFHSSYKGCFNESVSSGTYTYEGGRVIVHEKDRPFRTFLLIMWSGKRFLVAPRSMPAFCNQVRVGWRGEDLGRNRKFLRDGSTRLDETELLAGLPAVPAPWSGLLKRR